jgi:hypothetical protein
MPISKDRPLKPYTLGMTHLEIVWTPSKDISRLGPSFGSVDGCIAFTTLVAIGWGKKHISACFAYVHVHKCVFVYGLVCAYKDVCSIPVCNIPVCL